MCVCIALVLTAKLEGRQSRKEKGWEGAGTGKKGGEPRYLFARQHLSALLVFVEFANVDHAFA